MRNGFITLLIGLAGVPDAQELMPFLLDAYRMWGGKGYYVIQSAAAPLKRWIARGPQGRRPDGPALAAKAGLAAAPVQQSDMALYGTPATDADKSDVATIRALDQA